MSLFGNFSLIKPRAKDSRENSLFLIIFQDISVSLLLSGWACAYFHIIPVSMVESLSASAFAFVFLQSIRLGFRLVKGIEGMGSGDPEILAGIAGWVGLLPILHITTGAALVASCLGLLSTILYGKQIMLKLPFLQFSCNSNIDISSVSLIVIL